MGAVIIAEPDPPLHLSESLTVTRTPTSVGLSWSITNEENDGSRRRLQALDDGYSPIIDYRVMVSADGSDFKEVGSTKDTFFEVGGLNDGVNYDFRVQTRNEYGYSKLSDASLTIQGYELRD